MSNLPPTGPYGSPPPPPWQAQPQPGGWTTPPPPPPRKSNTPKVVVAAIVVAVIAVVGVVVATRGDDGKQSIGSSTDETENDETATDDDASDESVPEDSEVATPAIPSITLLQPTTTSLPGATTTTAPAVPVTVPFVLPAGALDLGYQVYIPIPEGFADTKSDTGLDTISNADGSTQVSIQALARDAGENPAALMQEYIDSFSGDFTAINFSSTIRYVVTGAVPAYEYGSYYEGYDPEQPDGIGVTGRVYVFQRADGLSILYDVFGPTGTMGLPDAAFDEFIASFEAAPVLGPVAALQEFPAFRPTTPIPVVTLQNRIGFTPTSDFVSTADPSGGLRLSSSDEVFTVNLLTGQATSDAAVLAAEALLGVEYTGLDFQSVDVREPSGSLTHFGIPWIGTSATGVATFGGMDVYWDPATLNAIVVTRSWHTTSDGLEPATSQTNFMFAGIVDDLAAGIPNP